MDVVNPSIGRTRTASSDPEQQLIIVYLQADHNRPGSSRARVVKEPIIEQGIQPPGLRRGTRKTVQHITASAIRQSQASANHVADQVVGNQLAPGHDRLGHQPYLGTAGNILPQEIPGGDVGNLVTLMHPVGLSAFSGTRSSEQHHGTYVTQGFQRHRYQFSVLSSQFSNNRASIAALSAPVSKTENREPGTENSLATTSSKLRPVAAAANSSA